MQPTAPTSSTSGIQTSNPITHVQFESFPPEEDTAGWTANSTEHDSMHQTFSVSSNLSSEQAPHKRIFWYVCSGSSRPLSTEVLRKGGDTLSVDNCMDLLDDVFFNC